jgi:hypothetical protein
MYNHCNMCNIYMKHLQHTCEISEIFEIYSCNMHFQRNISLLLGGMEAHWYAVFIGGNGPMTLVGGGANGSGRTSRKGGIGCMSGEEAVAARLGEGNSGRA